MVNFCSSIFRHNQTIVIYNYTEYQSASVTYQKDLGLYTILKQLSWDFTIFH